MCLLGCKRCPSVLARRSFFGDTIGKVAVGIYRMAAGQSLQVLCPETMQSELKSCKRLDECLSGTYESHDQKVALRDKSVGIFGNTTTT